MFTLTSRESEVLKVKEAALQKIRETLREVSSQSWDLATATEYTQEVRKEHERLNELRGKLLQEYREIKE